MTPVGDALVVEAIDSERVTKGGIIIPESEAAKRDLASVKAKVVALGSLAFQEEARHEKEFGRTCVIPRVGDTILIGKYAGYTLEVGGKKVRVIFDKDVAAILEEGDE